MIRRVYNRRKFYGIKNSATMKFLIVIASLAFCAQALAECDVQKVLQELDAQLTQVEEKQLSAYDWKVNAIETKHDFQRNCGVNFYRALWESDADVKEYSIAVFKHGLTVAINDKYNWLVVNRNKITEKMREFFGRLSKIAEDAEENIYKYMEDFFERLDDWVEKAIAHIDEIQENAKKFEPIFKIVLKVVTALQTRHLH